VSNRRHASPKPPAEAEAYADAYQCGHCTGHGALRRKADRYGVWHINVFHDPTCPVLTGAAERTASGLRAMAAAVEQTGTTALYVQIPLRRR
jgi:hypothetical protein